MDSESKPVVPSALLEGRFSGRSEFADLIRQAFAVAAVQGWREIMVCDPTFEDWPLGERAVAQALNDWAKTGRKFTMLAKNYDEVLRRHARFVVWRRTWSHIVDCRASASTAADDMPSLLWAPGWVFERLNLEHCAGVAGSDAARRVALRERLNERLLKSTSSFPATTLGL
ncbi:MAG TPA: hypothetical protein VGJ72_06150 [Polaromonas sp.]|jgi:hypothetical protein